MPLAEELGIENVQEILEDIFEMSGRVRGSQLMTNCPNPDHDDKNPSCTINVESGLWYCFSCGAKGDILALGSLITGDSREHVAKNLVPGDPSSRSARINARIKKIRKETSRSRPKRVRAKIPADYERRPKGVLEERGFTEETLDRFFVRYVTREKLRNSDMTAFEIREAVAIPIFTEAGRLRAWGYRKTDNSPKWMPRYIYTPRAELSDLLFGLNLHKDSETIVVVEGPLDAMWLDQHRIPAVALLGSEAENPKRIEKMAGFKEVTLFPDRDNAGQRMAHLLGSVLHRRGVPTRVVRYPSFAGSDPQECCGVDLELMVERAIPFLHWKSDLPSV